MRTSAFVFASFALGLAASAALAQDARPAVAPPAPAASAPVDCGAAMKRHDHGAERNTPSAKARPCASESAASGARTKAQVKPLHDHARVHKSL